MERIYAYGRPYKMIVADRLGTATGVICGPIVCVPDQGSDMSNGLMALEVIRGDRERSLRRSVKVAVLASLAAVAGCASAATLW